MDETITQDSHKDISLDSVHVEYLLKAHKKAGEKAATTVRIFEKNDFYYLFEKDAEFGAKLIYGSSTVTKTMGKSTPVTYCTMNHANFESLLRNVLLVKHYRVEIYKFVAPRAGNPATYDLEVRASPGNVSSIEHILYGEAEERRETNYLLAIKLNPSSSNQTAELGLAAVETSLNIAQVSDFKDTEHLAHLESILVQLGPREVLLPESDNALIKKIRATVERNRILVTQRSTKNFSVLNENEVKRLLAPKASLESVQSRPFASGALHAVTEYLGLGEEARLHVEVLSQGDYMRLDPRAVDGLNMMPNPAQPSHPSILSILNKTRTPGGSRLMQEWLKKPLLSEVKIEERLDLVDIFVNNTEIRQICYEDHLRRFPDFQRLSAKFGAKKANLQDSYKVYVAIGKLKPLIESLQTYEGDSLPTLQDNFIKDLQEAERDLDNFYKMMETTLDMDEVTKGSYLIKPSFDENLGELREELDSLDDKLQQVRNRTASELGLDTLKLEESGQQGFYFRLTLKEGGPVSKSKDYTVFETNKTGIKFRNSQLARLNEEQSVTRKKYEEIQKSVVQEIMEVSSGYSEPMLHLGHCISRLDCIVSFAIAAVSAPTQFCRPKIVPASSTRVMNFSQLRHPIVELQDNVSFIPNDLQLSCSSSLHLITGPNMGGKSTFLRSVGCAVLMAQCGSFVPADSAELSVTDSVLVRIGASDCQAEGRSTFMAEMVETSSILSSATASSLILIDELGRGTSTYDGFGLAWAVSEHIATNLRSFTLFTTHYTELTQLANKVDCVTNYHVSALTDQDKLTLLYQLEPGVCESSFGINVAQIANFPKEVIEEARQRMRKLDGFTTMEIGNQSKEMEEGEEIISSYFEQIKNLDGESDQDKIKKFLAIREEMKASDNLYVQRMVKEATCVPPSL